jgi:arabinofuranosyltransferase
VVEEARRSASGAPALPPGGLSAALPVAIVMAVSALFLAESWWPQPQLDDAYISYRYAGNLVRGHGLVYNVGEHVEGFTNLLWTLLVAAGMALGSDAPRVGHVLGVASGLFALLATYAYAAALAPARARWIAALAPAAVLASKPFGLWAISGMETVLFAAAVAAALAARAAGRMGLAVAAVILATATRPEGVLLAAIVLGSYLLDTGLRAGRAWLPVAAYALFLLGLEAFRLVYYGALLPNTFHAKVGGIPMADGARYVASFFATGAWALAVGAALACVRDARARAGGVWLVALAAYVTLIGGDAFPEARFLLPALPVLAALAAAALAAALAERRMGVALLLAGLSVAGTGAMAAGRGERLAALRAEWRGYEDDGRARALVLRQRVPPPRSVAAGAIGSLGYYTDVYILDIYGLTHPAIARSPASPADGQSWLLPGHQRSNADFVFAQRPDYLLIRPAHEGGGTHAVAEIWRHPVFSAEYVWDPRVHGYRRRDIHIVRPDRELGAGGPAGEEAAGQGRGP